MRVLIGSIWIVCTVATTAAAAEPFVEQLRVEARRKLIGGEVEAASTLFHGVFELSRQAEDLKQLAEAYTVLGRFGEATASYQRLLSSYRRQLGTAERAQIQAEVRRMSVAPEPFGSSKPKRYRAEGLARQAFKKGVKYSRSPKKTGDAIRWLRAALVLDPRLPGTYRWLAGLYRRQGDRKREIAFLTDYLRIRPEGRISRAIRKRLQAQKGHHLGTITVKASFPCDVYVNGWFVGETTPVKSLTLPDGYFTITCVSLAYHLVINKRIQLRPGKTDNLVFEYGVLKTELKPWARIRSGNRDLGLWPVIGLPARTHELELEAHDGSQTRAMTLSIKPGKTYVLKAWRDPRFK